MAAVQSRPGELWIVNVRWCLLSLTATQGFFHGYTKPTALDEMKKNATTWNYIDHNWQFRVIINLLIVSSIRNEIACMRGGLYFTLANTFSVGAMALSTIQTEHFFWAWKCTLSSIAIVCCVLAQHINQWPVFHRTMTQKPPEGESAIEWMENVWQDRRGIEIGNQ